MKKILGYQKLLGVDEKVSLKELKTVYRNLMKDCHPDKFQEGGEQEEAHEKSKKIIEAYHFLVSISSETHADALEEYTNIISSSTIVDLNYKGGNLNITYAEGNCYEYFDVPRALYIKLVNADTPGRFARRHICGSFIYRGVSKATVEA
ncbi:MAG: KTSC domain-containing protein [Segetibacter sp.]